MTLQNYKYMKHTMHDSDKNIFEVTILLTTGISLQAAVAYHMQILRGFFGGNKPGPEAIRLFSCSTQLSMNFKCS